MRARLIESPHRVAAGLVALLVLAAAVAATVVADGRGPGPVAATATDRFSAERALFHLQRFATEPRPLGSPASDRAREYLTGQLESAGFSVQTQRGVGARASKGLATFGRVDNVIATLPGRASTGTVLLAAHYDSAATGPGASDDGAAVAAMLEVGRLVARQGDQRNDLVLLFTDGEEDGLLGAETFAREHPLARAGGVVLNWEARGVAGPSLMFETSVDNAALVSLFATAVPHPRGDSSLVEVYRMMPNFTDFTALSEAGFNGLNFAYIENSSYYHTAGDTIGNLDRGSLQHHGENMLHLARALGAADLAEVRSGHDATYFRLAGTMITYSNVLVLPIALLAVVAVGAVVVLARRRDSAGWGQLLLAAASVAVPLGAAALLGQGMWSVLEWLRPAYQQMGGLLHRPRVYHWALVALAVTSVLGWYLPARRRLGPAAPAIGALVWPAGLGVVCAVVAPGASFLFALPALFVALGTLAALLPVRWSLWPVTVFTLGASAAAALLGPLSGDLIDGVGLTSGGAAAAGAALFVVMVLPLIELLLPGPAARRRVTVAVPVTAAVVSVLLIGAGTVVDTFDARRPGRAHLAYVLNSDTGAASWVSEDIEPADWTRTFVDSTDSVRLSPGYASGTVWTGPAEPMALDGPMVEVLHRDGDTVTVHVASRRAASGLVLRVDHRIDRVVAAVAGAAPIELAVTGERADTWPGEIRFRDLPPDGVDITVRTPGADRVRVTAADETHGLAAAPGFRPRPDDLVPSIREDGERIVVTRTVDL
ncbi:M28 family peptidase [Nocardia rhamnosiphila]|uniref:M28 family peptidase n=1 Tax=Nocardia rhamnosiphila TaxID=426716 RepID=UPI0004C428F2|nr:M28 family peptidase [Nocardia rhamnosiphila]